MRRNRGRTGTSACHFTANSGDPTADTVVARYLDCHPTQTSNRRSAPTFRAASVVSERNIKGKHLDSLSCLRPRHAEQHLNGRLPTFLHLVFCAALSVAGASTGLTCPPIDTIPSFDSAVLQIGPGGAVYAGPIGEAAKLWRERQAALSELRRTDVSYAALSRGRLCSPIRTTEIHLSRMRSGVRARS